MLEIAGVSEGERGGFPRDRKAFIEELLVNSRDKAWNGKDRAEQLTVAASHVVSK